MSERELIEALNNLLRTQGWKILIRALKDVENGLLEEILARDEMSLQEINAIKAKIWAIRELIELPEAIVAIFEGSADAGRYTSAGDLASAVAERLINAGENQREV